MKPDSKLPRPARVSASVTLRNARQAEEALMRTRTLLANLQRRGKRTDAD